jgi:hypothetical protein
VDYDGCAADHSHGEMEHVNAPSPLELISLCGDQRSDLAGVAVNVFVTRGSQSDLITDLHGCSPLENLMPASLPDQRLRERASVVALFGCKRRAV